MRMETAILRPQALHSLRSEDRILQTWEDPRRSRSSSIGIVTGYSTQLQVFRRMRMPRLSRLLQICHPGLSYSEILTVSARRLFLAPVGLLAGQSLRPTSSLRFQTFRHFRDSMRRAALHFELSPAVFRTMGSERTEPREPVHVDLPTPAPEPVTPPVVSLTELIVSRSYFNFWGTAAGEGASRESNTKRDQRHWTKFVPANGTTSWKFKIRRDSYHSLRVVIQAINNEGDASPEMVIEVQS